MSERGGILRNRWESSGTNNQQTSNVNATKIFRDLLERYPPNIDILQTAVLSTASSKYCSLDSQQLWGLSWEEFLSELEYSQMCEASESAAHRDAAAPTNK